MTFNAEKTKQQKTTTTTKQEVAFPCMELRRYTLLILKFLFFSFDRIRAIFTFIKKRQK